MRFVFINNKMSLSTLNVIDPRFESIRYDKKTKKVAIVDIAVIITGYQSNDASKYVRAALKQLGKTLPRLKINGKGNLTPVADVETAIQVIWKLRHLVLR